MSRQLDPEARNDDRDESRGALLGRTPGVERRPRFAFAGLLLLAASTITARSLAHGGGAGGAQLPPDPPAVTPDGERAKGVLEGIEKDESQRTIAEMPAGRGRIALGRAHGASLAGDREGAKLLSRVALGWANAASAAVRAALEEAAATKGEEKVAALRERLGRAKALLAESEARKLQLTTSVTEAEAAKDAAARAAGDPKAKPKAGTKPLAKSPAPPSGASKSPPSGALSNGPRVDSGPGGTPKGQATTAEKPSKKGTK